MKQSKVTSAPAPEPAAAPRDPNPAKLQRFMDPNWLYAGKDDTDVTRTWARFGWRPLQRVRGAR